MHTAPVVDHVNYKYSADVDADVRTEDDVKATDVVDPDSRCHGERYVFKDDCGAHNKGRMRVFPYITYEASVSVRRTTLH